MIYIYQGMEDVVSKQTNLTRHGKSQFKVNLDLIRSDMDRLVKYYDRSNNKYESDNIAGILDYLENFELSLLGSKTKLSFEYDELDILKSKPMNLMYFEEYNIRMCDYLVAEDGNFVRVDFPDLRNLLAFEMGKEDLGFSFERLESELSELNPLEPHSINKLKSIWEEEIGKELYREVMVMAAEDSHYYNVEEKSLCDYLQQLTFKGNKYCDALDYSCRRVMSIIAGSLMRELSSGTKYKLCEVTSSGITLYSTEKCGTKVVENELRKPILVNSVGRKFELSGIVTVY